MGVQQLKRPGPQGLARVRRVLLRPCSKAGGAVLLGVVRPGDRLVAFADDFADAFARGFDGCDVALVGSSSADAFAAASKGFDASLDAEGSHLWWFVNSIGGFGLRTRSSLR